MLALVIPGFQDPGRSRGSEPFQDAVPGFFDYLRKERGLSKRSVVLTKPRCGPLRSICGNRLGRTRVPFAGDPEWFFHQRSEVSKTSIKNRCGMLRVFLRYLHREHIVGRDLGPTLDAPRMYRLSGIPRSITWDEVRRMLEGVHRRTPGGKRDYAILLLLVTYGFRGRGSPH